MQTPNGERSAIERASPADFGISAMDTGKVPEQFAVILILERPGDLGLLDLRQLIGRRILALPRLRQRLIKVPRAADVPYGWMISISQLIDTYALLPVDHRGMRRPCLTPLFR